MTIIKLDAKALEALFPEGSEQKVELQKCVIAEFTKKAFSARAVTNHETVISVVQSAVNTYTRTLDQKLDEAFKKIQIEKLTGLGYATEVKAETSWGSPAPGKKVTEIKLNQEVVDKIRTEAARSVSLAIKAEIESAVAERAKRLFNESGLELVIKETIAQEVKCQSIKQLTEAFKQIQESINKGNP